MVKYRKINKLFLILTNAMTEENQAKQLEDRINLMKKYYCKGFGDFIQGIFTNAENYVNYEDEREKAKDKMLNLLNFIEKFYENIPFKELNSDSDFAPLFVVKDLLNNLKGDIKEILKEPIERNIKKIESTGNTIVDVGRIYNNNLRKRIKELKEFPGYEDFHIILINYKGDKFMM